MSSSLIAQHEHATSPQTDTQKKSIPREVHEQVGKSHVMLYYHSPAVRGRTIWGGLVPYHEVWVTGAHNATSLEVDTDFYINDKKIPAGKYALFTIPEKEKWIFILNKNWEQHLADEYDPKDDVLRIEVEAIIVNENQERLEFEVAPKGSNGFALTMRWEKVRLDIPVSIQ
jgi:hypothetical protein